MKNAFMGLLFLAACGGAPKYKCEAGVHTISATADQVAGVDDAGTNEALACISLCEKAGVAANDCSISADDAGSFTVECRALCGD